jgi:GNAT superfamily N-acetyltransferase
MGAHDSFSSVHSIAPVIAADLDELLPMVRAYCDFYDAHPSDSALLAVSRALLADPEHAGMQLIAREQHGRASGFATLFWSLDTLAAGEIGVMNDLYVIPELRGEGLGAQLIAACVERCRARGAVSMVWQTAPENARAQRLYDRLGASREEAIWYELALTDG